MQFAPHKRVKHLARYFGFLSILCMVGYNTPAYSLYFLASLGPAIFIVYLIRTFGGMVNSFIPNEPFFNYFALLYPVTFLYFGLVGFQLKNIVNERGKIRVLTLLAFIGFVIYIHYFAFKELSLYWEGSTEMAPLLPIFASKVSG